MNRYEVLILTIPEITKDEELSIEKNLEKLLNDNKGSIISFERWGKYHLAYPVKLHDYGVYFLVRFEIDGAASELLKEVKSLFHIKFNDFIMRNIITALKDGQSLEYKKPQSLEDVPKKHVGLFEKKDSRGGYGSIDKDVDSDELDEDIVASIQEDDSDEDVMNSASKVNNEKSLIVNADVADQAIDQDNQNQDEVA